VLTDVGISHPKGLGVILPTTCCTRWPRRVGVRRGV